MSKDREPISVIPEMVQVSEQLIGWRYNKPGQSTSLYEQLNDPHHGGNLIAYIDVDLLFKEGEGRTIFKVWRDGSMQYQDCMRFEGGTRISQGGAQIPPDEFRSKIYTVGGKFDPGPRPHVITEILFVKPKSSSIEWGEACEWSSVVTRYKSGDGLRSVLEKIRKEDQDQFRMN